MMSPSPLAEIRSAELAAARTVAAATEAADQRIVAARAEAVRMLDEARARGRTIADERHEAELAAANGQALQISRSVAQRIDALEREVSPEIDRLVEAMLGIVLPRPE